MLIAFLSPILAVATIILYPQPLFANKVEYKQFKVYSNETISNKVNPILDSVLSLVKSSELYDSTYQVDIFLSYNNFFNKIDDKVFGYGPTARAIDNNLIFKVAVDINKNLVYSTFHKPCEQRFAYLLAHEMVHCLQLHRYGMLKFNPFKHPPFWKLEGYPEYVARHKAANPTKNFRKDLERFVKLKSEQSDIWISVEEGGCEAPEYYYKGRLMTEYLMNVRRWTYDRILKDTTLEEVIYAEMIEWAGKQ